MPPKHRRGPNASTNVRNEHFVDTSALIAFLDRSDSHHALFTRLFANPPALRTSSLVIVEAHGWFLRRYHRERALQFLAFVDTLPMQISSFDDAELKKATQYLKKFADQNLTIADAHGLALMVERRIMNCWSTDRHLALTGATLPI